jgi:hypothetical protein
MSLDLKNPAVADKMGEASTETDIREAFNTYAPQGPWVTTKPLSLASGPLSEDESHPLARSSGIRLAPPPNRSATHLLDNIAAVVHSNQTGTFPAQYPHAALPRPLTSGGPAMTIMLNYQTWQVVRLDRYTTTIALDPSLHIVLPRTALPPNAAPGDVLLIVHTPADAVTRYLRS